MSTEFDEFEDGSVSKSQVKRAMHELQALGEKLVTYNDKQLKELNLPTKLLEAIYDAKKFTSHLAKRRQLQYIGRLMRVVDVEPIKEAIKRVEQIGPEVIAKQHQAEQWRNRLLIEGKTALTEFVAIFKQVDVQYLRHLIQAAKKEPEEKSNKRMHKELIRFIREAMHQEEKG
ncbi:MAG: hypothetical protein A3E87_09050 [Gammaproteobacteria bacterium RIFCSPHIGHO2_12_FULL_35_23]|nr:MAG: hypothetical protein A3E87_09050 [Gammaproteobacteria bacterium RIFCSPHIGHO2_12_FULL_35_23]